MKCDWVIKYRFRQIDLLFFSFCCCCCFFFSSCVRFSTNAMFCFVSSFFFFIPSVSLVTPRCHAFMPQFCELSIPCAMRQIHQSTGTHTRREGGFGLRVAHFWSKNTHTHNTNTDIFLRFVESNIDFWGLSLSHDMMSFGQRVINTKVRQHIGNQHSISLSRTLFSLSLSPSPLRLCDFFLAPLIPWAWKIENVITTNRLTNFSFASH